MKRLHGGHLTVYSYLLETAQRRGAGFLLLLDPDRISGRDAMQLAEEAQGCGVDGLLIGGSIMINGHAGQLVRDLKERTSVPIILFPGSYAQVTEAFDAVLFTSLISSRNPTYLIEEQVKGAPLVKRYNVEPIPTGYLLIESGTLTSVQFMSGSLPIPRAKHDIACAHALAAQYLGMKLVYLEAGSGAAEAVPCEMIRTIQSSIDIPIAVGGGIRTPQACAERVQAGASFVIVGTQIERNPSRSYLREMTAAVHATESVVA